MLILGWFSAQIRVTSGDDPVKRTLPDVFVYEEIPAGILLLSFGIFSDWIWREMRENFGEKR